MVFCVVGHGIGADSCLGMARLNECHLEMGEASSVDLSTCEWTQKGRLLVMVADCFLKDGER